MTRPHSPPPRTPRRRPFRFPARPHLERLEDRTVMSTPGASPYLPPQRYLFNGSALLTAPSPAPALDVARGYLLSHRADLGVTAADLDGMLVTRDYASDLTGTTHLTFQQTVHGLPVANANFVVNVTARGQVVNVAGGFVPQAARAAGTRSVVSAAQAVQAAANQLGLRAGAAPRVLQELGGLARTTRLSTPGLSLDEVTARQEYFATPSGVAL